MLAITLPAFVKHLRISKVEEPGQTLRQLLDLSDRYYRSRQPIAGHRKLRHCLPPSGGPYPPEPSADPVEVDFASEEAGGAAGTWVALGFQPERPLRYRYSILSSDPDCEKRSDPSRVLSLVAEGDLDGDGVLSRFTLTAGPSQDGARLEARGRLQVERRLE